MLFRKIRRITRSYFALTTRERRGIQVLIIVLLIEIACIMGIRMYHQYHPPAFDTIVIEQLATLQAKSDSLEKVQTNGTRSTKKSTQPFPFDPNHTTMEQWLLLGLSEKQAGAILRFVAKGGRFKTKEDLSKMYVIGEDDYQRLAPFVTIAPHDQKKTTKPFVKELPLIVELNGADSVALCRLQGIGPGRARMIMRYRESLGGFHTIEQLLEVYTIQPSLLDSIRPQLTLDADKVRTFNINADTIRHPYLNQKVAKVVMAYRKQHGPFQSVDDLKRVKMLDENALRKLAPYLRFE